MGAAGLHRHDALFAAVTEQLDDLDSGETVVVGCSGGADSVGLLHLVCAVRPDLDVLAVHVDHGLTDQSNAIRVVAAHARSHNVAFLSVPVTLTADGHGLEAAARTARYSALFACATEHDAAAVLLAHTADDWAETVWMRLLRGTGPDGLAAMTSREGLLKRPLLQVRRHELHRFVADRQLTVVHDPMNDDRRFLRVRIRQDLTPVLDTLGDDVVAATCRLAQLSHDDQMFFASTVRDTVPILTVGDVAVVVQRDVLAKAPVAVGRRAVRMMVAACRAGDGFTPTFGSLADVTRILDATDPARFTLAGNVDVSVDATYVTLVRQPSDWDSTPRAADSYVPTFAAQLCTGAHDLPFVPPPFGNPTRFAVTLATTQTFTVRAAEPGDTVWSRGVNQPVKALFSAGRVPVVLRQLWPVVCAGDTVVWVPGFAANDTMLATPGTPHTTVLSFAGGGVAGD